MDCAARLRLPRGQFAGRFNGQSKEAFLTELLRELDLFSFAPGGAFPSGSIALFAFSPNLSVSSLAGPGVKDTRRNTVPHECCPDRNTSVETSYARSRSSL